MSNFFAILFSIILLIGVVSLIVCCLPIVTPKMQAFRIGVFKSNLTPVKLMLFNFALIIVSPILGAPELAPFFMANVALVVVKFYLVKPFVFKRYLPVAV